MKSDVRATINNKVERERDEARAQVAELTKERDALDANRHRLIEIINSNLDERDEARAQVTVLTAENAVLREALRFARSAIKCGEAWSEMCDTIIDKALSTPNPKARRMVEELERHRAFVKQQSDAFDDFRNNEIALYNAALTEGEKEQQS
jgi:hypothetical protein